MAQDNSTLLTPAAATKGSQSQTLFIADIISEGPIEGLVAGESSVYLNNTRMSETGDSTYESILQPNNQKVTFTGASNVGLIDWTTGPTLSDGGEAKYIRLFDAIRVTGVTWTSYYGGAGNYGYGALILTGAGAADTGSGGLKRARLINNDGSLIQGSEIIGTVGNGRFYTNGVNLASIDLPASLTVIVDVSYPIASFEYTATTGITLVPGNNPPAGDYYFAVTGQEGISSTNNNVSVGTSRRKFEEATIQFRTGEMFQEPLAEVGGVGNTSLPGSVSGIELRQVTGLGYSEAGYPTGSAGADGSIISIPSGTGPNSFNLSNAQVQEVDELRLIIAYSSMVGISENSGSENEAAALYSMEIDIVNNGDTITYPLFNSDTSPVLHKGTTKSPIAFEHTILLEDFGPRESFTVRITRLTRHEGITVRSNGTDANRRYKANTPASITNVSSIIKEKFSYPYTAYAGLTFSSEEFDQVPQRTYHCRGLKVLIPSNYTTRENTNDGIASYTGIWNGGFAPEKTYTDNPAWIFHDIVTNDRYGVGEWISSLDIDIYALYRIGRYCDELVDDGRGGLEPRFRANLYLTKATDTYKIIKDMATIFLGMLYWMDGKVVPIVDQPNDAVYNFSKGNVIDGKFNYETTGAKTRPNQVVVSWNNPESNYEIQPLIVEDREAIVATGRIISQDAVAFGCTSEGQATRYGRWKLWTGQNQTEIVSFKTSLNAGYVIPGDVINVQDYDRYAQQFSGRIAPTSAGAPLSTGFIPLDRPVEIRAGFDYLVSVVITESSAVLAQDTAFYDGETRVRGYVLETGLTKEAASTTLFDASTGLLLAVAYNESSRVESGIVTNAVSVDNVALTVSPVLSTLPAASSTWVLTETETASDGVVAGSKKEYRVLSIAESGQNTYDIVAVEYYDVKYDAIDKDYTLGEIPDLLFPKKKATDSVPKPKNVYILTDSNFKKPGEEIRLQWDPPADYDLVAGYEIEHNIPGIDSPIPRGKKARGRNFRNVPDGTYVFGVRTVAVDGDKSKYNFTEVIVDDPFQEVVPRMARGIAQGGLSTSNLFVKHENGVVNNVLTFEDSIFSISPIQNPSLTFTSIHNNAATSSISVDNIVGQTGLPNPTSLEQFLLSAYIMFDGSSALTNNPFKVMEWDFLSLENLYFWFDKNQAIFTNAGGTVTLDAGDNIVTGVGTTFTNHKIGDILKLSTESKTVGGITGDFLAKGAEIVNIISDTQLIIDRSYDTDVVAYAYKTPTVQIDFEEDAIIARCWKPDGWVANTDSVVQVSSFLTLDASLLKTFRQISPPAPASKYNLHIGDIWYDTDNADLMYRWADTDNDGIGDSWEVVTNPGEGVNNTLQAFFLDGPNPPTIPVGESIYEGDYWVKTNEAKTMFIYQSGIWVPMEWNSLARALIGGILWDTIPDIQIVGGATPLKQKFVSFWRSTAPTDADVPVPGTPGTGALESYDIWYEQGNTGVTAWRWDDIGSAWIPFKAQGELSSKDQVASEDITNNITLFDSLTVNNSGASAADLTITAADNGFLGATAHTFASEDDDSLQAMSWKLFDDHVDNLSRDMIWWNQAADDFSFFKFPEATKLLTHGEISYGFNNQGYRDIDANISTGFLLIGDSLSDPGSQVAWYEYLVDNGSCDITVPSTAGIDTRTIASYTFPGTPAATNARKHAIVMLGLNDVSAGTSQATYEANYKTIVNDLQELGYTVISVLPPYVQANPNGTTDLYRGYTRTACTAEGVLEVWDVPVDSFIRSEFAGENGEHLTAGGHRMLAREMYARMAVMTSVQKDPSSMPSGRLSSGFHIVGDSLTSPKSGRDAVITWGTDGAGLINSVVVSNGGTGFTRDFTAIVRDPSNTQLARILCTVVAGSITAAVFDSQSAPFTFNLSGQTSDMHGSTFTSWAHRLRDRYILDAVIDAIPGASVSNAITAYPLWAPTATSDRHKAIIFLGANDSLLIDIGGGLSASGGASGTTEAFFRQEYAALIADFVAKDYTKIICINAPYNKLGANYDTAIDLVRTIIEEEVDAAPASVELWDLPTTSLMDNLHPGHEGQEFMAESIYPDLVAADSDFSPSNPAHSISIRGINVDALEIGTSDVFDQDILEFNTTDLNKAYYFKTGAGELVTIADGFVTSTKVPTNPVHLTNKLYVDDQISGAAGTGALLLDAGASNQAVVGTGQTTFTGTLGTLGNFSVVTIPLSINTAEKIMANGTAGFFTDTGYTIADLNNFNTAFGWDDHSTQGYALSADAVLRTGNQTIAGIKTFTGTVRFNGINTAELEINTVNSLGTDVLEFNTADLNKAYFFKTGAGELVTIASGWATSSKVPTNPVHLTNKLYVDNAVAAAGGGIWSSTASDLYRNGRVSFGTGVASGAKEVFDGQEGKISGPAYNTDGNGGTFSINGTGTPAAGFGAVLGFNIESGNGAFPTYPSGSIGVGLETGGTSYASAMKFRTSTSGGTVAERMRIDSAGNVGIGTTPAYKLHTFNTASNVTLLESDSTSWLSLAADGTNFLTDSFDILSDVNAAQIIQRRALPLTFGTSNAERMRIDSIGTVTIPGATRIGSPPSFGGVELTVSDAVSVVNKNAAGVAQLVVGSFDYGTSFQLMNMQFNGASVAGNQAFNPSMVKALSIEHSYINVNGVSFNTNNTAPIAFAISATEVVRISTTGLLCQQNITAYSDLSLKENLEVIPNALDKLCSLTGYTYDRIDSGVRQTGLVAQDVQAVLPEAVEEAEDGTLALAYGNLAGLFTEAIKELNNTVEELREEIRILKGESK